LDISKFKIVKNGGFLIAKALEKNSTLLKLNLSHNKINIEEASAIIDALNENYTLKHLDIRANDFKPVDLLPKINSIENFTLETLHFNGYPELEFFPWLYDNMFRSEQAKTKTKLLMEIFPSSLINLKSLLFHLKDYCL